MSTAKRRRNQDSKAAGRFEARQNMMWLMKVSLASLSRRNELGQKSSRVWQHAEELFKEKVGLLPDKSRRGVAFLKSSDVPVGRP